MEYPEFEELLRSCYANPFRQGYGLCADLLRPMINRDYLRVVKAKPQYQRILNAIEGALPPNAYEWMKAYIGRNAADGSPMRARIDCPFDLLCCYASNIHLPVRQAVAELGYRPVVNRARAAELTTDWLRFID